MMLPEYHDNNFSGQHLQCSNCGWTGKGHEAVVIDFFGVTKNKEIHCPNCDKTIGILQGDEDDTTSESASD